MQSPTRRIAGGPARLDVSQIGKSTLEAIACAYSDFALLDDSKYLSPHDRRSWSTLARSSGTLQELVDSKMVVYER